MYRGLACSAAVLVVASAAPLLDRRTAAIFGAYASFLSANGVRVALRERQYSSDRATLLKRYLPGAGARVVEVGMGGGATLACGGYPEGLSVAAVEPQWSPQLREQVAALAKRAGVQLTAVDGVAEALPFAAESLDAAVTSLVLCTVPDPERAVSELWRVLKPGGTYIFVEHIRADGGLMLKEQELLDPLQQALAGGCHLTRTTDKLLLSEVDAGRFRLLEMRYDDVGSRWPCNVQVFGALQKV
mmetsp:Transcript_4293/g.16801  ORF Transcript_4293/g.16801 Transcript_4293/m.16801 type:complete len:244 (-) Transcript_4293:1359-2090(-)